MRFPVHGARGSSPLKARHCNALWPFSPFCSCRRMGWSHTLMPSSTSNYIISIPSTPCGWHAGGQRCLPGGQQAEARPQSRERGAQLMHARLTCIRGREGGEGQPVLGSSRAANCLHINRVESHFWSYTRISNRISTYPGYSNMHSHPPSYPSPHPRCWWRWRLGATHMPTRSSAACGPCPR